MFLVLEFRVHEDAQDLDMVLGLHGLSFESDATGGMHYYFRLNRIQYNSQYNIQNSNLSEANSRPKS